MLELSTVLIENSLLPPPCTRSIQDRWEMKSLLGGKSSVLQCLNKNNVCFLRLLWEEWRHFWISGPLFRQIKVFLRLYEHIWWWINLCFCQNKLIIVVVIQIQISLKILQSEICVHIGVGSGFFKLISFSSITKTERVSSKQRINTHRLRCPISQMLKQQSHSLLQS